MRKFVIVSILAASLGLSACGTTVTASLDQAVNSLGSTPALQVHLTASLSGSGMGQAESVVKKLSIDMRYWNPTGAPLSQAGKNVNSEIVINLAGSPVADIREVDTNDYVKVDLTNLASIPGVNLPSSELSAAQLILGGRWFEVPKSLITSELPPSSAATATAKAQAAKDQVIAKKLIDALSKLIDTTKYTTLSNGAYRQSGSLTSVVTALAPTITSVSPTTVIPSTVQGSYTLTLERSGANATGASVTITAPNGAKGNASIGLAATISHDDDTIVAPSGAVVITPSLLKGLESGASL